MVSGVFFLASCSDLHSTPSVSASALIAAIDYLENADSQFAIHILIDDRQCPGLCSDVIEQQNHPAVVCHSAADSSATVAQQNGAVCPDRQSPWTWPWTWQAMLPQVLQNGTAAGYDYLWIVESDVFYIGNWGALLVCSPVPRSCQI